MAHSTSTHEIPVLVQGGWMTAHFDLEIDDYTHALTSWTIKLIPPEMVRFDNGRMSSKHFSAKLFPPGLTCSGN